MPYSTHKTYYNQDGIEVPSATTVLKIINKPHLQKWSNIMGFRNQKVEDILEKSSEIGTQVHALIEAFIMKKEYHYVKSKWYSKQLLIEYLDGFITWYLEQDIEPIFAEKSMSSNRYGGTIDFYGKMDGLYTILDWKTSKDFYLTMFIQLAAYCQLLEEKGKTVEQVAIVRVNKGKIKIRKMLRNELEPYIVAFNNLLDFFHSYYDLSENEGWGSVI